MTARATTTAVWILALVTILCLDGACPSRGKIPVAGGMSLRAGAHDLVGMDSYTDDDVLRLAAEAFDQRLFERAYRLYRLYLDEFPDGSGTSVARFNGGLAAEHIDLFEEAIALYEIELEQALVDADRVTIRFRLVACTVAAAHWTDARHHISTLLRRPDLATTDRFELRVQLAWVDAADGQPTLGQQSLETLVSQYHHDRGRTLGATQGAMAQYYLGEVFRLQAEAVLFSDVDDLDEARRDLNTKATFILDAQDAYLDAIRVGEHDWIPRAGYRLGGLYEQFRVDILAAPLPSGVTVDEDREIYREILSEQTAVLLMKAQTVYRKVLDKAAEVNMHDEWVVQLRESLTRLEAELLAGGIAVEI
jgi:tetratricopeptide (TPR) repeat protein